MTLYEVEALRGHALLEPTEETRKLPEGNILTLLRHLTTLQERGVTKGFIFTPGEIVSGSEITFFVGPGEGKEFHLGPRTLNQFTNTVMSSLLIPAGGHGANYVNKSDVELEVRENLEEGSLAVPKLTFKDEFQEVIRGVFVTKAPRTQDAPAVRLLGIKRKPDEFYRKTLSRDKVNTVVYLYHDANFAHLAAKSVQLLCDRQNVAAGYQDIFHMYRDLVAPFIQRRHTGQMQRGTFRITEPEAYLHSLGIPLTQEEAGAAAPLGR
ncbi:hypothetical protein HYZ78_02160 [Candidatus Microgenomates bacterium]|nr:hypothetical protein [Candidatus Microgenomates bacterium]